jgi:putative photosynthetic complex assembly protein 2
MQQYAYPILFTLLVWWISTGVILYLDGLPQRTYRWSFLGATGCLIAALTGLAATRAETSIAGGYVAFACAIVVWGWQEMGFLMGFITGPRQTPCPPGAKGWQRFVYALEAILYHELAIIALAVAVLALTRGGENQVGTGTFLILWVMRVSAKLNVFLGVRNLYEDFLPAHLRYLQTYFRKKAMNLLFPFSVSLGTAAAAFLWRQALAADAGAFNVLQYTFFATLLSLAVLEHWFLVLPLPAEELWRWGLRSREAQPAATAPPTVRGAAALVPAKVEAAPPRR